MSDVGRGHDKDQKSDSCVRTWIDSEITVWWDRRNVAYLAIIEIFELIIGVVNSGKMKPKSSNRIAQFHHTCRMSFSRRNETFRGDENLSKNEYNFKVNILSRVSTLDPLLRMTTSNICVWLRRHTFQTPLPPRSTIFKSIWRFTSRCIRETARYTIKYTFRLYDTLLNLI